MASKGKMNTLDRMAHLVDFMNETLRTGYTPGAGWTSKAEMDARHREHGPSPFGSYQAQGGHPNNYGFSLQNQPAPAKEVAPEKPGLLKGNIEFVNSALASAAVKGLEGIGKLLSRLTESAADKQERQLAKLEKQLDKHEGQAKKENSVQERRMKVEERMKELGGRIPDASRQKMNEHLDSMTNKPADSRAWQKEAKQFEKSNDSADKARLQADMNKLESNLTNKERESLSKLAESGASKAVNKDVGVKEKQAAEAQKAESLQTRLSEAKKTEQQFSGKYLSPDKITEMKTMSVADRKLTIDIEKEKHRHNPAEYRKENSGNYAKNTLGTKIGEQVLRSGHTDTLGKDPKAFCDGLKSAISEAKVDGNNRPKISDMIKDVASALENKPQAAPKEPVKEQAQQKAPEVEKPKEYQPPHDKDGKPVWTESYMSKNELQQQAVMQKNIDSIHNQLKAEQQAGGKDAGKETEIKLKMSISDKNEPRNAHKAEFAKDPQQYVKEHMGNFQQNERDKEQRQLRQEAKTATQEKHGIAPAQATKQAEPEHRKPTHQERLAERQKEDLASLDKSAKSAVEKAAKAKEAPAKEKAPEKEASKSKSIVD
jgi:hypothetical protein